VRQSVPPLTDRLFPLGFMRELALERLGIAADVIDTGHLPALSRPDELAPRLENYGLHHSRQRPKAGRHGRTRPGSA
jgi:hypothetical protein